MSWASEKAVRGENTHVLCWMPPSKGVGWLMSMADEAKGYWFLVSLEWVAMNYGLGQRRLWNADMASMCVSVCIRCKPCATVPPCTSAELSGGLGLEPPRSATSHSSPSLFLRAPVLVRSHQHRAVATVESTLNAAPSDSLSLSTCFSYFYLSPEGHRETHTPHC